MTLTLPREHWGERLHRAYRYGREQHGYTYESVARQISRLGMPLSQQTLIRLEENETAPKTGRGQLNAWLALTAYGFEAADFGLKEPMGKLLDWDAVRKELDPSRWAHQIGSVPVRSRWSSRESAGTPDKRVVTA